MKKKIILIIFFICFIIPLLIDLKTIYFGLFPFWFDPAQSLLLGLDNLNKFSLIGHPSGGIFGLFYGPYDIWLICILQLISKDPRLIVFGLYMLPYFTIFPFILYKFSKLFGKFPALAMWVLYILHFNSFATRIWNPNPAPILALWVIYLLITINLNKNIQHTLLRILFVGVLVGLLANFHLSFGLIFMIGVFISQIIFMSYLKTKSKKIILLLCVYILGILITFIPFMLFEIRHNFLQTKALLNLLTSHVATLGPVFSKLQIITHFLSGFSDLVGLPVVLSNILLIILLALFVNYLIKHKKQTLEYEKKLVIILLTLTLVILGSYLGYRRVIWDYYFIGTEIIFLLFLGYLLSKYKILKFLFTVWILIVLFSSSYTFFLNIKNTDYIYGSLASKEEAVKIIGKDANNINYVVFAYDNAIYTYDYSYLFKWLYAKNFSYDPGSIMKNQKIVYLIIPPDGNLQRIENFVNYYTPNRYYLNNKTWELADGLVILKKIRNY